MGRSTEAKVSSSDRQVTVSQHDTDAPVLPISQLERLKVIHPERVDWVFEETTKEAGFRRSETSRVNTLVFVERLIGTLSGLIIGCVALFTAYHLAMADHEVVAGIIGGTTVVGLVSAFVIGAKRRATPPK